PRRRPPARQRGEQQRVKPRLRARPPSGGGWGSREEEGGGGEIGRRTCVLPLAFSRSRSGSLFCGGKGHTDSQKARTPDSCGRRRPWTRRPNVLSSFQRTSEGTPRLAHPFRSNSRHVSRPPACPFKLSSRSTRASPEPGSLSSRS